MDVDGDTVEFLALMLGLVVRTVETLSVVNLVFLVLVVRVGVRQDVVV